MTDFAAIAAPFAAVAVVVLAVVTVLLYRRTTALAARMEAITRGSDGKSLEAVLDAHIDKVYSVARDVGNLDGRTAVLEAAQRKALARVGLVRFNPFEDTGGNQSFALAVLDANGDGWIVSSLHSRQATRVYGKAISSGRAESQLSAEEDEALRQALGRSPGSGKGG